MSTAATYPIEDVTGVVLAGGRARRMGGHDKGLVEIDGRPMVVFIVEALKAQTATVVVNANRNLERYRELCGCVVVPDTLGEFAGPLAGMAAGMESSQTPFVLTAPCDSPLISRDLGARLFDALEGEDAELAVAHDGKRMQPVFALLRRNLLDSMIAYLRSGESKIDTWYATHRTALADFSDDTSMFLNVNTPEDRLQLESSVLKARES
ncbi:MAG: molybdenum cofactor guanylyltransferase MobA [Gammaproteobacteria bacterium]|nr:molybdenum cofactor guanylyltransferase MobA [Gammaproteobacteria bacterium]